MPLTLILQAYIRLIQTYAVINLLFFKVAQDAILVVLQQTNTVAPLELCLGVVTEFVPRPCLGLPQEFVFSSCANMEMSPV